jgi:hypothetical protein
MQVITRKEIALAKEIHFSLNFLIAGSPPSSVGYFKHHLTTHNYMANTFGILSALVLAFSAFVAYKNKEEFEQQKQDTALQETSLKTNNTTFAGLVKSITSLEDVKGVADKSRDDFNEKLEGQAEKNKTVEAEIASQEKNLATTEAMVADANDKLKELGPIGDLAPKIERLKASITEYETKVATLNTQKDRLSGEKSRTDEALASAKRRQSEITSGRSFPTMKTKIRSIDRRLGIVTLAAGIRSGVIGGSKVAVIRGGEKIGELSIKAVSANFATADVIQSALKEGEDISVGDTVVPAEVAAN